MEEYLFILGRNPELSLLELASLFIRKNINYKIKKHSKQAALIFLDKTENQVKEIIHILGGTLKIAKPIKDIKNLTINSNKIFYGINKIDSKTTIQNELRSFFKENKVKAMEKYTKTNLIAPSDSQKLDLEIVIYENKPYEVISSADPKEYKNRDENRPYFEAKSVISIRLAKMLINLSQVKNKQTLLDPFVGLGTIGQEALLMGIPFIGSDKDPTIINKCKENLDWLKKKNYDLYISDIDNLSKKIKKADAVASEPYLGPYIKKMPTEQEARATIKELYSMFSELFEELQKIKIKKIAIIIPYFITNNRKTLKIPIERILEKYNFRPYTPLRSIKTPIEYNIKGSKVKRSIWLLENIKN